jgi:hypothetical protein
MKIFCRNCKHTEYSNSVGDYVCMPLLEFRLKFSVTRGAYQVRELEGYEKNKEFSCQDYVEVCGVYKISK